MSGRSHIGDRRGLTVVEILVSLTVMSGALMALAAATGTVARLSRATEARGHQTIAVSEASGLISALAWDDLPTSTTCRSIERDVEIQECISVQTVASNHLRFTIVVSSSVDADTVVVERRRTASSNPFNVK